MTEFYDKKVYPRYWTFTVAANAASQYEIDTDLPNYVKKIIGICVYTGGVDPANTAMITLAQSDDLFLCLMNGKAFTFDKIRLDQMIFSAAGGATGTTYPDRRFLPVNLDCNDIDLNTSYIFNPTGINAAIMFGILYI